MIFQRKKNHIESLLVEKNEQIFYIKSINKGDTVFDVGANIGELTMLFSKFVGNSGQVHSFEPTPATFDKLSAIMEKANKTNVKINNVAVSNKTGLINFNMYKEKYAEWNTIAMRPLERYGIHIDPPQSFEIIATCIDDYCIENSIKSIDLLKIDVEGAELNVLKGAEKMFSEKKIKLCAFEFGQTIFDMGNTVDELKGFFKKNDYYIGNVSNNQTIFPVDRKTNLACFSVLYAKPVQI